MTMRVTPVVAALLVLGGTGCTGDLLRSDAPAAETFRLTAVATEATQPVAASPLALVVQRPRAPAALDTERVAVSAAGNRFDYYSAARWAEPAPQMVQQQLVGLLSATGQFGGGVFAAPARVPAELMLVLELRRFEAVTTSSDPAAPGSAPTVHVQLQASLVDTRRGARVASFVSEATVAATANRLEAVVAAFDLASAQVLRDVTAKVQVAVAALPAP